MFTLILTHDNQKLKELHFTNDKEVTIGRKSFNDVVIEHVAISGSHARIEPKDGGFLFSDLHSKNGSFVNKEFVNSHWLADGDIITIGEHAITFLLGSVQSQSQSVSDDLDRTVLLDSDEHRDMRAKSFLNRALNVKNTIQTLTLKYLSGGEGHLDFTQKKIRIGKHSASEIRISGFFTGSTAATIELKGKDFFIEHTGGLVKPRVNGTKVQTPIKLQEYDIIKIGPTSWEVMFTNRNSD
jgi:pSer/pThr/pTyr-binding forkhead associated (FHA) protein